MTLKQYISQPGHTAAALAREIGVATSTITRAAHGQVTPSGDLMRKIIETTRGAVTPNDFFDLKAVA